MLRSRTSCDTINTITSFGNLLDEVDLSTVVPKNFAPIKRRFRTDNTLNWLECARSYSGTTVHFRKHAVIKDLVFAPPLFQVSTLHSWRRSRAQFTKIPGIQCELKLYGYSIKIIPMQIDRSCKILGKRKPIDAGAEDRGQEKLGSSIFEFPAKRQNAKDHLTISFSLYENLSEQTSSVFQKLQLMTG